MPVRPTLKQLILLAGDAGLMYTALLAMLSLRYVDLNAAAATEMWQAHWPFAVVFVCWLVVFYIAGLYDIRELKNGADFYKRFAASLVAALLIAVMLFYFVPAFEITPRANLFLVTALFATAGFFWRIGYNRALNATVTGKKVLLVGSTPTVEEFADRIAGNPQIGYKILHRLRDDADITSERLAELIRTLRINIVVVPAYLKKVPAATRAIYRTLSLGVEIADLATIYETAFGKIPLAELEEVWFLENLSRNREIYDAVKQPTQILLAAILFAALSPLFLLIAATLKLTSPGSAFFTQVRIGKGGKPFVLWKFRTMRLDAEKNGPQWAAPDDRRTTPVGRVLRAAHLDELPQLINIVRGELSLIGPRPERPEFVEQLRQEIPFYDLRHLIKPGLTGWAQINYRYGASVEEAREKLQYDIYYLKNRSLWLDATIALKTAKRFFVNAS